MALPCPRRTPRRAAGRHPRPAPRGMHCRVADPQAPPSSSEVPDEADVAGGQVAWDPQNLLGDSAPVSTGRIEQRLAERRKRQAGQAPTTDLPIQKLHAEDLENGGIPLAAAPGSDKGPTYAEHVALTYMPINVADERVRVVNLDPPVLTIDGFLGEETCDALVAAARDSGALQRSGVGAGNVGDGSTERDDRRTSRTLLVNRAVQSASPRLKELAAEVQGEIQKLLPHQTWGAPGALPPPGGFTFEALQVATYAAAEHFRGHEDGFPWTVSLRNAFQRRATVLVYLNDVASGGRTRFTHLDLSIEPKQGRALVFFPAFKDGHPDERTLHEAEDAEAEKWVAQQWCACGLARPGAAPGGPAKPDAMATSVVSAMAKRRKGGSKTVLGGPRAAGSVVARPVGEACKPARQAPMATGPEDEEEARLEAAEKKSRRGRR